MYTVKMWRLTRFSSLRKSFCHQQKENASRLFSLNSKYCASFEDRNSWVVLSNNGRTIVCWHPETPPPYEHTKPLPKFKPEIQEGDSVLKVQYRYDEKYRFKADGPTVEELAKMTYTSKHRWYPKKDKEKLVVKLDPNPPPIDREGL